MYKYTDSAALNTYISDKSYIYGYTPSSFDVQVYNEVKACPDATKFPHAARWYNHINSFTPELREKFPTPKCADVPAPKVEAKPDEDDLFAEDDEDTEAVAQLQAKAKAAAKAKEEAEKAKADANKKIDKSQIGLDIKGWDETTDFEALVKLIHKIEMPGLVWGEGYKIEPVAFGVNSLKVTCVVEDDKVTVDDLTEKIEALEDYVQSVDIFSFNKM